MDPSRYQAATARFEEALDLAPAARAAWLRALETQDPELAALVERMLRADAEEWEPPPVAEQLAADMLEDPLAPGSVVGGLLLEERVGAGGMAAVWRAVQQRPHRRVALKILHPWQRDPLVLDRFRFEADALARLRHHAFPEVHAVGEEDGRPWIAMELVEGAPLHRWLADALPSPATRLRVLIELVDAVAGLHALGLVHRDLKPANVLIDPSGGPRVVDLGVATDAEDAAPIRQMAVGTPGWSSPEQSRGAEASPASDVYALGVIGRLLLLGAQGGAVPAGVPVDLRPIFDHATAERPADRYPDAAALAGDLRRARDSLPVAVADRGLRYRAQRWVGRHRRALTVAAYAAGALLVAGAATSLDRWVRARAALEIGHAGLAAALQAGARLPDDPQVALDELQEFLLLPESEAVAWEAWLATARAADTAGSPEEELDALSRAWSAAAGPAQEGVVLERTVDALLRRWSFPAASAAARHAGDSLPPETRARLRLLEGDLPGALALMSPDDPRAPLVRALSRATRAACPSALQATTAGSDGRLFAHDATRHELIEVARTPELPPLRSWPLGDLRPEWPRIHLVDLGAVHLLAARAGQAQRLEGMRLDEQGLTPVGAWPEARVQRAVYDPTVPNPKILFGTGPYERHLVQLDPQTWRTSAPAHEVNALESDVMDVELAALDDDDPAEVLLGFGPWWAYGVARLDRDAAGELHTTARATLGFVHDVTTLRTPRGPRVVALKSDRYAAADIFGEDQPFGPHPPGIYLLHPADLSIEASYALPTPLGQEGEEGYVHVQTGDLDGDGLEDLAVWVDLHNPGHAWILRQLPEGGFADILIADLRPVLATDLDGDGDDELAAISGPGDGSLWVLGAGDAAPPRAALEIAIAVPPASGLRTELARDAWSDAEVLRELGLGYAAAKALLRAADHAPPDDAELLAVRAGGLAEAAHELPTALEAFQRGLPSRDLTAAVGLHRVARTLVQLDAAWEAARRLTELSPTWQGEVDRLAALRAQPSVHWRADGSGLPDEAWQLPRPAAIRRTDVGLDIALLGGQGTMLSLPLRGDGARAGLRATFDLEQLDPGVELEFQVIGPLGPLVGVTLLRDGRTGAVSHRCGAAGLEQPEWHLAQASSGTQISIDAQRVAEGVACRIAAGDDVVHLHAALKAVDLTPTAFVIRDSSAGDYGGRMSTLARLVLHELTVDGAEFVSTTPDVEAWQVVAGGAPTACGEPDTCLVAALRRGDDLHDAVAAVLRTPIGVETLRLLLRVGTPLEVERLRQATTPELFAELITGAWSGTLNHAPTSQVITWLDQPWLHTITPSTEARVLLLGRIARSLAIEGRYVRAAELFGVVTQPGALAQVHSMARLDILLAQARTELALGHPERAAEALERALAATPAPEVVQRRIMLHPGLAAIVAGR